MIETRSGELRRQLGGVLASGGGVKDVPWLLMLPMMPLIKLSGRESRYQRGVGRSMLELEVGASLRREAQLSLWGAVLDVPGGAHDDSGAEAGEVRFIALRHVAGCIA